MNNQIPIQHLLHTVAETLRTRVAPDVSSAAATAALQMAAGIVDSVADRSERETEIMRTQIPRIETLAKEIVSSGLDAGPLPELLREYETGKTSGRDSLHDDYNAATAVFIACIEVTIGRDDAFEAKTRAVLEEMLLDEIGEDPSMALVGRG